MEGEQNDQQKSVCWLTRSGVIGTIIYLFILGAWLAFKWFRSPNWQDWERLLKFEINTLGDFLAGAFGPPAFLWLVLGFFLQRRELQQSTEALRLQAEELRNSVEQQRELVEVNRKQAKAEIQALQEQRERERQAALPNFVFRKSDFSIDDFNQYTIVIQNVGGNVTNVRIDFHHPNIVIYDSDVPCWFSGDVKEVVIHYDDHDIIDSDMEFSINFVDLFRNFGIMKYRLVANRGRENFDIVEI